MQNDKNIISAKKTEIDSILKKWGKKQNKKNHDIMTAYIGKFKKDSKYKKKDTLSFHKYADALSIQSELEGIKSNTEETLTFFKFSDNSKKIRIKYIPFKKNDNFKKMILIISASLIILLAILFLAFIHNIGKSKIIKNVQKENAAADILTDISKLISDNSPVYFNKNSSQLAGGEEKKLSFIIEELKKCSNADLLVEGYTANVEKPQNEILLSQNRADRVKKIISEGLDNKEIKIEAKGYGSKEPVTNVPEKLNLNRRVEIKLLDYKLKK